MSVVRIGDSVIIEEDIVFKAVDIIKYKGETYIYGFKAPKSIEEAVDPSEYKKAFLREIVEEETEECFVEEVEDPELVKFLKNQIVQAYRLKK